MANRNIARQSVPDGDLAGYFVSGGAPFYKVETYRPCAHASVRADIAGAEKLARRRAKAGTTTYVTGVYRCETDGGKYGPRAQLAEGPTVFWVAVDALGRCTTFLSWDGAKLL